MMGGVHIVLLAAGHSSRTGPFHKLLATFDGEALVRRSAKVALASQAAGVSVVVGHRAAAMRAALRGLPVRIVENPNFADGLSTSLIAGLASVPAETDGFLVMLADQPLLTANDLDLLLGAFSSEGEGSIVVATDGGRRFNPVVISCLYRTEVEALSGDAGAKRLLAAHPAEVREVEIGRAASFDVDTPEALAAAGGIPEA